MSEEVTWKKARHLISGQGSTDQAADMDDRIIELDQHKLRELLIIQEQEQIRGRLESQRTPEEAVSVTPNLCSNCRETQQIPDQAADMDQKKELEQSNPKLQEWMLKQKQDRLRGRLESQRTPEGAVSVTPSFCSNCRETQEVLKLSMKFGEELHHNLNRVELILHQEQTLREEALAEKMKLMRRNLELEFQLESRPVKKDIPRQQKQLENRILELEAELEEERNNVQTLTANAERRKEHIKKMRVLMAGIEARIEAGIEDFRRPNFEDALAQLQGQADKLELRLKADGCERVKLRATNRCLAKQVEQLSTQIDSERQEADKQKEKVKKMCVLVAGTEDFRRSNFEDALAQLQGQADKLELRLKADDCERVKLQATNHCLAKQVEQLSKQIDSERQEADKQMEKVKRMRVLMVGIEDFWRPNFEDALAQLQGQADKLELRLKADDCERVKLRATNHCLAKQVEQLSTQIDSERQEADKQQEKATTDALLGFPADRG